VIDAALVELEPNLSLKRACALLGRPRASHYRSLRPPKDTVRQPRASPPNALTPAERKQVLAVLRTPEHCDLAVAQVWARELDEGRYYCSISSMYRILRANGEVRERRSQATHPAKVKPELVATKPNVVWSWDITKLRGPDRGVYYDLYVILDIYSRYVVGWTLAPSESGELAKDLIADCLTRQQVTRDTLSLHADRGTSMTSKPVSQLLIDLGVVRSHSRPHVSNDNPYSEAAFKTLKYCPSFPDRLHRRRPRVLRAVLRLLQPRASSFRDRPSHRSLGALRHRRRDPGPTRRHPERRLRREPHPVHPTTTAPQAADDRVDQPAHRGGRTERMNTTCLTRLDRFRSDARRTGSCGRSQPR
jgi:putative transposase